jgi:hypothetical protein
LPVLLQLPQPAKRARAPRPPAPTPAPYYPRPVPSGAGIRHVHPPFGLPLPIQRRILLSAW